MDTNIHTKIAKKYTNLGGTSQCPKYTKYPPPGVKRKALSVIMFRYVSQSKEMQIFTKSFNLNRIESWVKKYKKGSSNS